MNIFFYRKKYLLLEYQKRELIDHTDFYDKVGGNKMKKVFAGMCMMICFIMSACGLGMNSKDNPLSGKSTEERMIMALEQAYPGSNFEVAKKYGEYDGWYYAEFHDENGLKFKVDNVIYNNHYHFGCYDEYMVEILNQQNFLEKATKIANKYGYTLDYDNENKVANVVIPYSEAVTAGHVAAVMKEILHTVNVPEMYIANEEFSTGEVNYYSQSKMREVGYVFTSGDERWLATGIVNFIDRDQSIEELSINIQTRLDEAKRNAQAASN